MKQNQNLGKLQTEVRSRYQTPVMSTEQVTRLRNRMEQAKRENRRKKWWAGGKKILVAAASIVVLLCVVTNTSETAAMAMQRLPILGDFIRLVTVKKYHYKDGHYLVDIDVGELVFSSVSDVEGLEEPVRRELEATIENINEIIRQVTETMEFQFEETVETQEGYLASMVKSEQLETTENYFAMKLNCFTAAGSGYEWNYYFMIDLTTGKQMTLADLFPEGADYITPISADIRMQMQNQMAEDAQKQYWVNSTADFWGFKEIKEDESFYVNADGGVVICFDEGDVAPMYMGTQEFEISPEVIEKICSEDGV